MDLLEYQARDLFEAFDVPVLSGRVARTPQEARARYEQLGSKAAVIKAQVRVGGRGKAGGVKLAKSADEAEKIASDVLGMDIKGHRVHQVMLSPGAQIDEEYYFSILLDRSQGTYLAMCSKEGGMDIETLAVERPEALVKMPLHATDGITPAVAREIVEQAGFAADDQERIAPVLELLWTTFQKTDATLVEVNPLVKTAGGQILALDGKITLDDNAAFRHPEWEEYSEDSAEVELERQAR